MADQELIYRITRAVYDRLGSAMDESVVEQLVTDVYRTVEPALASERAAAPASAREPATSAGSSDRIIISVFGVDHPGIVAGVAEILSAAACSIIDINQTVVQGKFAMVIIADARSSPASVADLKDRLRKEGEQLGVHIYAQREDLFNAMHRV